MTTFSVDYSCSTGMVTVTWNLVFGANSYRATAVDGTGESLNCTSASSSCQITMLKCGEKYRVTVTAISDDCESTSTNFTLFETGEQSTCSCVNYLYSSVIPFSKLALSVPHHLAGYVSHMHAHTFSLYLSLSHTLTLLDILLSSLSLTFPISLFCGKLFRFLPWCPIHVLVLNSETHPLISHRDLPSNTSQSKALYSLQGVRELFQRSATVSVWKVKR